MIEHVSTLAASAHISQQCIHAFVYNRLVVVRLEGAK